ncbi:similar to Saccharomyces cerevisiae YDL209C CWC2 Member of the NineTeen Complex (NTC) that contains Prp19p and stabilizes U6 snRNA in catalytic forms of the spliceosome containing U2 [Maudiozyma saulgeensis]|uniref:Pre-mRNA-splicing factor CWC2 n=1 Tax=Maudiozyma saulgeensis TaxID=1789683 RepID=A0A1X7RC36_9SACH|nr:similar to Saccharomyces cerevisiae YDL209C CWC2 Member of the NineTeen Complex (NTC) that contains Prp19p and stabilizes U6 snRNA in catalytic forms of the spliceosome containing U2 [Kazachstania saulgeensis]
MWKSRPARQQIKDKDLPSGVPPQNGLTFNLWYNKWSQGSTGNGNERHVTPFRLDPKKDQGTTRASSKDDKFCIYFARGCCVMGSKCSYMHHVPDENDAILWSQNDMIDCFGREKHAEFREDMGGIGSFRRQNATLYIGGITNALNGKPLKPTQIESRIRFMFTRLGSIDRIRYITEKNCAFVKYRRQINAEFAREAMMNQSLLIPNDKEWDQRLEGAGLLVKWASDDPNPEAKRHKEQDEKIEMLNILKKLSQEHNARNLEPVAQNDKKGTTISNSDDLESHQSQFMKQAISRMKARGITVKPNPKRQRTE